MKETLHRPKLHELLKERIFEKFVVKMEVGQKLPTEVQLAKWFSVSVPTVREALRALTQDGYLERRQGSGTFRVEPHNSEEHPGKTIGVVTSLDLGSPSISRYFSVLIFRVIEQLKQEGYFSQIYSGRSTGTTEVEFDIAALKRDIEDKRLAGVVIVTDPNNQSVSKLVESAGLPCVSNECSARRGVSQDMRGFLRRAITLLESKGSSRIACLGWVHASEVGSPNTWATYFQDQLAARDLTSDIGWMRGDLPPGVSGAGYSLFREIWGARAQKPDGLIICDEAFFPDVKLAVAELGIRIPEDLRIVTHANRGDNPSAAFPFSILEYDTNRHAAMTVSILLDEIRGKDRGPHREDLGFKLIEFPHDVEALEILPELNGKGEEVPSPLLSSESKSRKPHKP